VSLCYAPSGYLYFGTDCTRHTPKLCVRSAYRVSWLSTLTRYETSLTFSGVIMQQTCVVWLGVELLPLSEASGCEPMWELQSRQESGHHVLCWEYSFSTYYAWYGSSSWLAGDLRRHPLCLIGYSSKEWACIWNPKLHDRPFCVNFERMLIWPYM
jgi:hypothetical protein